MLTQYVMPYESAGPAHNTVICRPPCTQAIRPLIEPSRQGGTVWLQSGQPSQSRSVIARAAQRALPLIMVLCADNRPPPRPAGPEPGACGLGR